MSRSVEAVEKVPKQILGSEVEKNDLAECTTFNDSILGKGKVTPQDVVLTGQEDFSYRLFKHLFATFCRAHLSEPLNSQWRTRPLTSSGCATRESKWHRGSGIRLFK
jgi:hypothetical protein